MQGRPRKRTTPNPSATSVAPTERDLDALADLVWAGFLSTRQIERLHFPSRRRAQRRLRALLDHGLVRAHLQAGALERENAYTATPLALERLAEAGFYDGSAPALGRLPRISKLAHGLATRDVFVAARLWERGGDGRRLEALFEGELARDAELREHRVVPDALLILEVGGANARLFVEIDLGTETTSTLRAKMQKWASWGPLTPPGSRLLFVCERAARLRTISTLIAETGLAQRCDAALFIDFPSWLETIAPHPLAAPPGRAVRPASEAPPPVFSQSASPSATAFRPRVR